MGRRGRAGWSGVMGREWENCNSIINKYIKKKKNYFKEEKPPVGFILAKPVLLVFLAAAG